VAIGAGAPEAGLDLSRDRGTPGAVHDPPSGALGQRRLREHVGALACVKAGGRAPDDSFRPAEAVGRGGVDPVDSLLERAVDRGDRFVIVLGPPAVLPVASAERPRAKPDAGDRRPGVAESGGFQGCCLGLSVPWFYFSFFLATLFILIGTFPSS